MMTENLVQKILEGIVEKTREKHRVLFKVDSLKRYNPAIWMSHLVSPDKKYVTVIMTDDHVEFYDRRFDYSSLSFFEDMSDHLMKNRAQWSGR